MIKTDDTLSMMDKININLYNNLYSLSIAKEATSSEGNGAGILIIGLIVVVVALAGYIMSKNK